MGSAVRVTGIDTSFAARDTAQAEARSISPGSEHRNFAADEKAHGWGDHVDPRPLHLLSDSRSG